MGVCQEPPCRCGESATSYAPLRHATTPKRTPDQHTIEEVIGLPASQVERRSGQPSESHGKRPRTCQAPVMGLLGPGWVAVPESEWKSSLL